jgi:hypothetical protein
MNARMLSPARLLIICGLLLPGCGPARDVAVSTFRVLDTPHRLIRERIDSSETTTTTVETTETSDVVTPGRPVVAQREPSSQQRTASQARQSAPPTSPRPSRTSPPVTQSRAQASATPRTTTQTAQFPIAKPVPGRPGYVYSIDPKGGIVDVTGYKSGDRAKDPYTQQVFVVP